MQCYLDHTGHQSGRRPAYTTLDCRTYMRRTAQTRTAEVWEGVARDLTSIGGEPCLDLHLHGEATKGNQENLAARIGLTTLNATTPM